PPEAAPAPMMDVPGLLRRLQRLPARHALASLPFPEVLDPAPPRKGMAHLPGQPFLQVRFPRRIVRVGVTPDLPPPQHPDPGRRHQPDRPGLAVAVAQDAGEGPGPMALPLEVTLLDPPPALAPVTLPAPAPELPEDPVVHGREGAATHREAVVHGPALDLL